MKKELNLQSLGMALEDMALMMGEVPNNEWRIIGFPLDVSLRVNFQEQACHLELPLSYKGCSASQLQDKKNTLLGEEFPIVSEQAWEDEETFADDMFLAIRGLQLLKTEIDKEAKETEFEISFNEEK